MGECFLYGNGSGDGCKIKFDNYLPMGSNIHTVFPDLFLGRTILAATTVGAKALFGGGTTNNPPRDRDSSSARVDAYTEDGVHTAFTDLSVGREYFAAITVGTKALFGGGHYGNDVSVSKIDAYTVDGARTNFPDLSIARYALAAATIGMKALFGGGYRWSPIAAVDAYTESGTFSAFPNMSVARGFLSAATIGAKALFAGGTIPYSDFNESDYSAAVEAYTENGVLSSFPDLTRPSNNITAGTVGTKAIFCFLYTTLAYTEYGALSIFPERFEYVYRGASATVGNKALFSSNSSHGNTEAYTEDGVHTAYPNLSVAREYLAAATAGTKALFGGGSTSESNIGMFNVDAYIDDRMEDSQAHIHVMPGGTYDFGSGEKTVPGSMISNQSVVIDVLRPVNGYIKYKGAKYSG